MGFKACLSLILKLTSDMVFDGLAVVCNAEMLKLKLPRKVGWHVDRDHNNGLIHGKVHWLPRLQQW